MSGRMLREPRAASLKRLLIWLFIIAVAVVGAIAARIAIAETRPYKGYAESEQFVEIPGIGACVDREAARRRGHHS
jgi:hypothetical protein